MAKRPYSTNKAGATQIKIETVDSANSALRVGTWMENLNDSSVQEWDSGAAYAAGQIVVFEGALAQVTAATTAGQSPVTHAIKWSRKIIIDSSGIALGNNNPVSGNALQQLINSGELGGSGGSVPNASTTTFGKVRLATVQEQIEGVLPDAASTPEGVYALLDAMNFIQKTLLELAQGAAVNTTEHPSEIPAVLDILNIGLAQLKSWMVDQNIQITGNNNYILRKLSSDPRVFRGLYYIEGAGGSGDTVKGRIGYTPDNNSVGMISESGNGAYLAGDVLFTDARLLRAGASDSLLRTLALSVLPAATKPPTMVAVPEDNGQGSYNVKFVGTDQIIDNSFPRIISLLAGIGIVPGGDASKDTWRIDQVCDFTETVPPPTEQRIDVASANDGTVINHLMEATSPLMKAFTLGDDGTYFSDDTIRYRPGNNPNSLVLSIPGGGPWSGKLILN